MRRPRLLISCFALLYLFLSTAPASAAAPELNRLLADIQKTSPGSPQERDLQKSVIALVQKMKTPPPVPEEARRRMARGGAFVKEAKDKTGYDKAIREFRAAAREAPWLPQPYFNLGVVQDKAGQYDAAMESLRMYLLAERDEKETRQARDLIYEIEARKELAGKQETEQKKQEQARLERERAKGRAERERREAKRQVASVLGHWKSGNKRCSTIRLSPDKNDPLTVIKNTWAPEIIPPMWGGTTKLRYDASSKTFVTPDYPGGGNQLRIVTANHLRERYLDRRWWKTCDFYRTR